MAERLRYTVNILEDLDKIKVAGGLDREHFLSDLPALGVAVGLALQATGVSQANVNLMPGTLQVQNLLNSKRWAAIGDHRPARHRLRHQLHGDQVGDGREHHSSPGAWRASAAKNTDEKLNDSKAYLDAVAPAATRLALYDSYGSQSGLMSSVLAGVTDAIGEADQ